MKVFTVIDLIDGETSTVKCFTDRSKAETWFESCVRDVLDEDFDDSDGTAHAAMLKRAMDVERYERVDADGKVTNVTELHVCYTDDK